MYPDESKSCATEENKLTPDTVEQACKLRLIDNLADEYLDFCYGGINAGSAQEDENDGNTSKRKKKNDGGRRFPNVAGFCRYFGIGRSRYERLSRTYPDEFEKLLAIFEDEALNSFVSASLLTSYLKKRLGYGDAADTPKSEIETPQFRLIFDHDILGDGE